MSTPDALIDRLRGGVYGLNRIALCEEAAAELRRQHAEIERLRDELNLCCALKLEYQQQAAGGIERLCAEIERLRADAARYRWLRDTECSIDVFGNACALTMDSAIDAAMRDAP